MVYDKYNYINVAYCIKYLNGKGRILFSFALRNLHLDAFKNELRKVIIIISILLLRNLYKFN